MTLPFLAAKTRFPIPTTNLVARHRLLASLDASLRSGVQVMLVAAPAGAGKTTLLTQWMQHLPTDICSGWLALDESDNSLAHFLSYFFAAMPSIGREIVAQIESNPAINIEQAVAYLVEQTAEIEKNLLLVLDDYHVITSPAVHQALKLLIDHLPSNLRLVIAGRVEPPLPLARLRAHGQLVEIRAADLRFHVDETSEFLARFAGLESLSGQDMLSKRLTDTTEGWAAGLQMSALALRGELTVHNGGQVQVLERFVDGLDGSHRYILDYLLEEVLSREPDRIREFLLCTCLLERFNADLCAALCSEEMNEASTQSMLEDLERANLFIIPLDNQREWYRYHHLFADMLQKQLLHAHPGLSPELHRRAADWFERHGMLDEAIAHAHRSGDDTLPRVLVENYALETLLRGQIATAIRWLDSIPAETLLTSPRLCLDRAWALTFTSQTEAAVPYLERAEAILKNHSDDVLPIKSEILGLQSYQKSIYGQTWEALCLAKLALENSPAENHFLQCSNRMFLASALVRNGKLDEALNEYHFIQSTCQDEHGLAGLALLEADFLQFVAVYLNSRNEANRAIRLLKDAIQTFETVSTGNRKAAALYLYVGLGKILYIGNNLVEAERILQTGLKLDSLSRSLSAIDGWLTLWWVKIGQRDYLEARHILETLEASVHNCDEKVCRLVKLPSALQDLLEGKIDSAAAQMQRLGFTDDIEGTLAQVSDSELMGWRSNEYFVFARVLAARGKSQSSLRVLNRMEHAAKDFGMNWLLYRTWITQATVYYQDKQTDTAMDIMANLLEQTSHAVYGAVQIYLSTGEPARIVLLEAARRGIQPEHVTSLLAAFPSQVRPEPIPDSPETLTEREVEVLRLMAEGLKNQEIADRLVVSLNTIRYHSKNIFGKLGVDNRTSAVAHAREIHVLI